MLLTIKDKKFANKGEDTQVVYTNIDFELSILHYYHRRVPTVKTQQG